MPTIGGSSRNSGCPSSIRAHWEQGSEVGWPDGWLVRRHELHVRRGGFSGTISALEKDQEWSSSIWS